jgi:hypothetical protein
VTGANGREPAAPASPAATPVGHPGRHAYCPLCGEARAEIRASAVRDPEAALCPERCLPAWQALEALREHEASSERVAARRRLDNENGEPHRPALSQLLLDRWRGGDWTVAPDQVLREVKRMTLGGTVRREDFERMNAQDVRRLASAEGGAQSGKATFCRRPWQQVLDEMEDAGVPRVGALNAARVRTLYEGVSGA